MKIFSSALVALIALVAVTAAFAGPVNVNTADAKTLSEELAGIGLARAQAIVEYRKANGPFRSVDDLLNVKGVGQRTLEMNRANILLSSASRSSSKGG